MSWKTKGIDGNIDANFEVGSLSAKGEYENRRGNHSRSASVNVKAFDVSAEANITLGKAATSYGDGAGTVVLSGPNAGVDAGVCLDVVKGPKIALMAEASACKARGTLGPLYAEASLNANTGIKINKEGVKVNFLGFGLTLGVGGKFTVDTPFGSAGGCSPMAMLQEVELEQVVLPRHRVEERVLYAS